MARTFSSLAAIITFALLASIGVGFLSFFLSRSDAEPELRQTIFIAHFFLGLATAIGILLVHCLIFIYFLGTGRWVKEVTLAYRMPDEPHHKQTRELKRKTFPPALFAMLIGIATAAAGAGAQLQAWHWSIHMTLAFSTLLINLWAFRVEYRNVSLNAGVIQGVLEDVDRIRLAHGLQPNAEALLEEEGVADVRQPG
jgi:amino acid transporter